MAYVRDVRVGDRFHFGGRWYDVTAVSAEGFDAFDGWITANFTFAELESPNQWRVVHLCRCLPCG